VLKLVLGLPEALPPSSADRRVIVSDPDGTAVAFGSRVDDEHWVSVPEGASFHFRPGSGQVSVSAHPGPLAEPEHILDAYYDAALPMAVQVVLGGQAVHASAVVAPETRVAAFCGLSHTGKTTIAYGLSRRGYPIWADDVVAFDTSSGEGVWSLRLPFRLNLRAQSAAHFEGLPEACASRADGGFPEWARVPLAVLFVLQPLDRARPALRHGARRLSPKEALLALLANAFCFQPQTPHEKRKMMQDYLEVVACVPIFRLEVRPGLDALVALLDEIEETVARHAGPPS
jgi:hypothetical protein